ncbi:hypothetical protein ES288_A10G217500v1 [Gossypium darwinii]|uniref:PB1-like domain-containing protein n=1 Tax=Gossypium darwinii TaxID=34276 RepID=A0A5D2F164_GOSDA|nr:hypothetical protein ES288_A10G217500v1 [Gossypium darwinii]
MMSIDDEYYIILHVDGHFVKDSYVRYVGGEVIRLKEDPNTISYFELCKIVKMGLGFNTVMLIYFHEPGTFKEIELYVEHEVDNPIIVDETFLLTTGEGDVEGLEVHGEGDDEGVESDGEDDLEKVESGGEGDVGEVQADGEGVSASESGGHISLGFIVGEDNDSEVAANEYAGDFVTSDGVNNVADEYVGDFATLDGVDNVADEYADDFATSDRLDNVAAARTREEDGNQTKVWDSDEHGSLVESDEDEEHEDGERMRSKFPLYNDKLKFSLRMLFKDGKQFKSAIRKYSKECRKQLKFIKNEPKRVVTFQDKHHCSVSFKNKMVTADMIAQHFEATIKDHPKMKLREIQRRCASEMYVNKIVNE